MTHEERIVIAQELARRIGEAHGDAVLAVYMVKTRGVAVESPELIV